ncbi:MAG TPA: hypothetical protein VIY29_21975 [Ktedonobacteraceae bacterium]
MISKKQPSVGWSVWLQWFTTSIIGGLVGIALMAETPPFLVGYFGSGGDPTIIEMGYSQAWAVILGATLGGAAIGSLQWLILRRQITNIHWWGVASMAGFALGFILVWAVSGARSGSAYHHTIPHAVDRAGIVGGAVIGAVMGSVQWLILRWRCSRAGWWVVANSVGFAAGWAGAAAMPVTGVAAHFVGGATFGILFGAVTGAALVWLLRHPAHSPSGESQNPAENTHLRQQPGRSRS